MRRTMPLARRHLFAMLALTAAPAARAAAKDEPGLLVASPPGAWMDRWADLLSASVGRALPSRAPLLLRNVGGLDGVTGANTFEARGEPDGSTALLVPGAATLSWLVGETRAKFDPARWLPLWAATTSSVLVSRVQLAPGRSLRIAASGPTGPELPALLALDLFGANPILTSVQEAEAVLLQGAGLPGALQAASAQGLNPVLSLGLAGPDGRLVRDSLLPTVPTACELVQGRASPRMIAALQAASLAAQLEAGLVLQQLTPAAAVAAWRRACLPVLNDPDLMAQAARHGAHMLPANGAANWMNCIAGNPDTLLTLRQWLATRYDWRPA